MVNTRPPTEALTHAANSAVKTSKRFIYGFVAVYLIVIACILVFLYRLTFPNPFTYAAIDPVPGAERIFHYVRHHNLTGATEVWVFKIPREYYEKLYKDCSTIKYSKGPYLQVIHDDAIAGTGAEKYLDPKAPSCYDAGGDHFNTYISEFRGDKLVIFYDHPV